MGKLNNKNALITGASSGIGKRVAQLFAEEGANVAINYPNSSEQKKAEQIKLELERSNYSAITLEGDVSNENETGHMVQQFIKEFGQIDILVNNAGIGQTSFIEDMTIEMWDGMIATNLRSVFLMTKTVLPYMYKQGHGKIINTASQLAYKGAPGLAHYTASKAAIISFTRSLSLEIGTRGINVNCVAPGATTTPILDDIDPEILESVRQTIPRGRFATVDEIAPTFLFLASNDSDHYVGQCLSPNGGDAFL